MRYFQLMLFLFVSSVSNPASSILGIGDVVFDPSNYAQNITSAISEVTQELKQVEQYTTQLRELMTAKQQLDDMLQNTKQLAQFNWDDAQGIVSELVELTNTIDSFKNQMGSFDNFPRPIPGHRLLPVLTLRWRQYVYFL